MFEYTISSIPDDEMFYRICSVVEKAFPFAQKKRLLVDVDYSMIQEYDVDVDQITVLNSYYVGEVYVKSTIDLDEILRNAKQ